MMKRLNKDNEQDVSQRKRMKGTGRTGRMMREV